MISPDEEVYPLLETIFEKYGYDFREYSEAHVRRRVNNRMVLSGVPTLAEARKRIITDEIFAVQLLSDLSITVTEMFRDPAFYKALREEVVPLLKTYSFIKVWHAGCSTGEEVYSMAILLHEEGLGDRTTLYATDFNQQALTRAREGIFANELIRDYTANYQKAGGKESFSNYYTSSYNMAIMNQSLKRNIVWANHNLVTDGVFAEVNLILCRNVLIYFNRELQNKVQHLFFNSLINGGIVCLGSKESLRLTDFADRYAELNKKWRIFKKKY
jgi:chemotaxis protein methyltransferase CheR